MMLITVNVDQRSAHRIGIMHACAPSLRSRARLAARGVQHIAQKSSRNAPVIGEHITSIIIKPW